MKNLAILLLAGTALAGCAAQGGMEPSSVPAAPVMVSAPAPVAAQQTAEDARLLALVDSAFDEAVARSPEFMTSLGFRQGYGRLDNYTDAARLEDAQLSEAYLARLQAEIDYDALTTDGQLTYDLFKRQAERSRRNLEWRWHDFVFSTNGSPTGDIPAFLINQHRVDSVADAEAYVSRLREVERVMSEISANIRMQAEMGIVPPQFVFEPVRADAQNVLKGAPFDDGEAGTLLQDFTTKVEALSAPPAEKSRLIASAREALTGPFRRGYDTFFAAMDAVEPLATSNDGAWRLPRGAEYYANNLRNSTTTELSADAIHRIGLNEVERIQGEMRAIMERVGFKGTLQQFFEYIKTDPQFKYPNTEAGREQYLEDARGFVAQVMAKAPEYFRRLPEADLEVRAVEDWRELTAPVAFYNRPAPDGSRPGIYYVNLADMTQVLKPQIEGISYHEGAPGHHFQIARAMELEGLPKFRRFGGYGVYSEGWGLYAERLGREMGFYQDPYSEFGHLSLELWRAVRLVTDTGLHAKRWSREDAIRYFQENSLLSERDIVKEVERYINWPGQATSYKIGQLKIVELRQKAEQALGDRFDIRDFHEVVLADAALPLDLLEERVDAYIAQAR